MRRNQVMMNFLLEKIQNGCKSIAIIFPGGKGTHNMYNLCLKNKIKTIVINKEGIAQNESTIQSD